MNKGSGLISIWLSFTILILSAGLVSHVMSIPVILGVAERDSWLSVLVAAPLFLLWLSMVYFIINRIKGQRLPDWIRRQYGIVPEWIFRISAALVLFASAAYTLQDTSLWTVSTYMQQTPMIIIIVTSLAVALMAAYGGLKSIALTTSILLPIVISLGYFVMIVNTRNKDYSLLLPILDNGWKPVMHGSIYALAGLLETWILLLYQHELKSKIRLWHLLLLGVFLISMAMGPTIGAITEFGPQEAAKQRQTAFEQWRILQLGELLQHVDFLSIYQWLCGSFARISIALYLITDQLDVRKPSRRLITLIIVAALMIIPAVKTWRDDQTLHYLQNIHFPSVLLFVVFISSVLAIATVFKKRKEKPTNDA
ncbi:endospore germination permease [Paenibacillus sp. GCM10027627]|uniref:GerAB/ArcD/ProY family transporter n=1 Tax=unclassified Paenibacillus TaxID=185978 RepID=UPI0036299608